MSLPNIGRVSTPQPHFMPGYTGYCPQYMYRIGNTYSSLTHRLLIDPTVAHSEKLILSDRTNDEYSIERQPVATQLDEEDRRREDDDQRDTIYHHTPMPGYEGYIPRTKDKFGKRYAVTTTEGLSEFERDCQRTRAQLKRLRHRVAQPISTISKGSLGERMLRLNDYEIPLRLVRPDALSVVKEVPMENLPPLPGLPYFSRDTPPMALPNEHPEKWIKLGYTGHKPFLWPRFGEANVPLTSKALCDFTNSYNHRRSTDWEPITLAGAGTTQPSARVNEIYHKTIGLLPNYQGHVPGAMFRFGKTFGNDSKDAKKYLKRC
ncbi:UPF0605 protein CG18335-like [Anopheles marshallii]|uniref:UPF0605 protein CG18335-like n=1 Tax=Anopheles marshallii TaxID=1521116 RepID=UPI00237B50AA|nr:UPF0605 protein CG18335-like [Anopheles marshallii]